MKKDIKIFLLVILFISSFLAFNVIEFEPLNQAGNKYLQSLVFSATFTVSIFAPKFRMKLFYLSFFLLLPAVILYLLQQLMMANVFSSISVGMLLLISISYVPELLKKGYVEKL